MRVLLKAPVNPHSGYGNDGIGIALALRQAGCDVYLDPTSVQAPLPPDVAQLLTKRLEPPFDLLLHHVDPAQLGLSEGERRSASTTLAWTMWEMSTLDNCSGRSKIRKNLKGYDLVVGYDAVSTGALDPYVSTNAATVQGGFWPKLWPQDSRRNFQHPTLKFCMAGALGPRKDPFVAIDAFRELREEHPDVDIALSLKTVSPGLHSKMQDWIPGLQIYYETWPEDMMRDFYASHHVLIATSRGEGKNMPALEFMSTGGPVIATNWGGHTQWLSPALGYPLSYSLGPVNPNVPNCLWAKADKDHLKQLMLHAYRHRDELARKGETAARLIPEMCSWPKAIDRLMQKVGEINEKGERVLHHYRAASARAEDLRQGAFL
jgi:glycosyltransferase involved in cell wall biosynthesis